MDLYDRFDCLCVEVVPHFVRKAEVVLNAEENPQMAGVENLSVGVPSLQEF